MDPWLSLELGPSVWWHGLLSSLVYVSQVVWGLVERLAVRIQALSEQQRPQQGEPQRAGLMERPVASQPVSSVAFFGGHLPPASEPAAFFGAHPSAILTTGHRPRFCRWPFQGKQPPSRPPTRCFGLLCLALPTREHQPFWSKICQLQSVRSRHYLSREDLFPFTQTWESLGPMELEGV